MSAHPDAIAAEVVTGLEVAVAAFADDGTFVFVNDAYHELFSASNPCVGSNIHVVFDYAPNATFFDALLATIADGESRVVRNHSRDHGRVYDNVVSRRPTCTVVEVRDVTDLVREAEMRGRLDEARRLTWSRASSYFLVVDVVGQHVTASDDLWKFWPVAELEAIVKDGTVLEGINNPTSYADPWIGLESASDGRVARAIAEVYSSGLEQQHRTVVPISPNDVRHLDVEWLPWIVDGVIRGAIMVGHDVTSQVLAEQREQLTAASMKHLLDRLPVTLWQVAPAQQTAWPLFPDRREVPDPLWGRPAPLATTFAFLSEESIGRLRAVVAGLGTGGQQSLTVSSADEERWLNLTVTLVEPESGGVDAQILVVASDVTDEVAEAETDRRMDHATHVMRFAQGVAHDFGNVAQVIGGYAELLAHNQEPLVVEQASVRLRSAALRAVDVSRRIAEIARVQQVVNGPVDLSELLMAQVSTLRDEFDPAVHLTLTTQPNLVAFAEALNVSSAVENLCLNAAEAMQNSGHINVDVSSIVDRGREYVQVSVSDDGPGIPPEVLDRVFDPFVTGRPTLGTGLGLYLIQEYLYSVGGQVTADNTDQGAVFRMRFQAARDGQSRIPGRPPRRGGEGAS